MRRIHRVLFVMLLAGVAAMLAAAPASAHVVPATVVELDVHADDITADVTLPAGDLATASELTIPQDGLSAETARQIAAYLQDHLAVTTTDGTAKAGACRSTTSTPPAPSNGAPGNSPPSPPPPP